MEHGMFSGSIVSILLQDATQDHKWKTLCLLSDKL